MSMLCNKSKGSNLQNQNKLMHNIGCRAESIHFGFLKHRVKEKLRNFEDVNEKYLGCY